MSQYYKTDLAKIHDEGFSEYAEKSFNNIYDTIKKYHKHGLVLELGCGTTDMLCQIGFKVHKSHSYGSYNFRANQTVIRAIKYQ